MTNKGNCSASDSVTVFNIIAFALDD